MDVMVVEDDPGVREATCEVLREEGYAVVDAGSPPEALERLGRFPGLQTVLVDIHLGLGISGIALAGRIRRTYPRCRILLTSGGEPPEGAAFDGFVAKPFSTRRLLAALRSPIGSAAGERGPHLGGSRGAPHLGGEARPLRGSEAGRGGAEYRG